jgi:FMN reductase
MMCAMRVLCVAASPAVESRSASLLDVIEPWLRADGAEVERLRLRELPAAELLAGRVEAPEIAATIDMLGRADGVVITTPIYKAAYSGLLKVWLDLLPQLGLVGKTVLPLATGGSLAHVLALDYALRPVLSSLAPRHISGGWFVLDRLVGRDDSGATILDEDTRGKLRKTVDDFVAILR